MDQFASLHGKKNQLLKLDCRSLEYEPVPFNLPGYRVVLLDTQVKHSLASSEYNVRRAQCEAGVAALQKYYPEVKSLRDADLAILEACRAQMDATVFLRCQYVVEENIRLLRAVEQLKKTDIGAFGYEMLASHEGLRHKYAVSCAELDLLVDAARKIPGVAGARMMGGGFGGCTINVIADNAHEDFIRRTSEAFAEKTGKRPFVYDVAISDGARQLA
jgi:galactokinase